MDLAWAREAPSAKVRGSLTPLSDTGQDSCSSSLFPVFHQDLALHDRVLPSQLVGVYQCQ